MRDRQEPKPAQGKRQPGRPEEKKWPAPIDATPKEVARALMQGPPKKDWRYLKKPQG